MPSRQPSVTGAFRLTDQDGREVTQDSYSGRMRLVYFGFTHCRVVCPRALSRIDQILDQLGTNAQGVVALYITVDPVRDTPEVMGAFLRLHHPRIIGLTGDALAIDEAKRAFQVFTRREDPKYNPADYAVQHTAFTYLMDEDGVYVTHFSDTVAASQAVEVIAQRLMSA
jgi:protein SCO1/2